MTNIHTNKYGDKELSLDGCSIQVPYNFNVLRQAEVDSLMSCSIDSSTRIVAAGINSDESVTFVTLSGDVLIFDPVDNCIPGGEYVPLADGLQVFLPNSDGRWPDGLPGFTVNADWLLQRSRSALDDVSLAIDNNYCDEVDSTIETSDSRRGR